MVGAEEKLLENGYEGVKYLMNYSYDTALIGVTTDNRAVYDYSMMVNWLISNEEMTYDDAVDWIEHNTLRALPYMGEDAPIVIHVLGEI
jgi:hypothetical protein